VLYILIPIHNNIKETVKCLTCINNQTYTNYEVVIVNDGSTDNSSEIIKEKFPKSTILEGDGNMWWAEALNKGIEYVFTTAKKRDYILILNNDLVFDNNYLKNIVNVADQNQDAIIGSLCKNQKTGTLVDSGVIIDWKKLSFSHKEVVDDGNDLIQDIDVLSTRGLIVSTDIIKNIGNFIPNRIRHYLSDYEYTIRIKNHGYRLLTSKKAVVYVNTETTGIHTIWDNKPGLKNVLTAIFSLKSSSNLKSWLFLIHLCCPSNYKIHCYWKITGGKVLEIIGGRL
jgi:GT2 family glycosyltransferase